MKEIVIKIPDNTYKVIKDDIYCGILDSIVYDAIKNGTELPKGHGKLKDIGKCDRKLFYQQCGGANSLITASTAFDMLLALPTIIEADKEEE